jgi:hypothetical protein
LACCHLTTIPTSISTWGSEWIFDVLTVRPDTGSILRSAGTRQSPPIAAWPVRESERSRSGLLQGFGHEPDRPIKRAEKEAAELVE